MIDATQDKFTPTAGSELMIDAGRNTLLKSVNALLDLESQQNEWSNVQDPVISALFRDLFFATTTLAVYETQQSVVSAVRSICPVLIKLLKAIERESALQYIRRRNQGIFALIVLTITVL